MARVDQRTSKTYLTSMTAHVTVSSKGQIVIPKDVRDALSLKPGEQLAISHVGRRIVLELPDPARSRISYAEFRLRVPKYSGPRIAIEDMTLDFQALWGPTAQER